MSSCPGQLVTCDFYGPLPVSRGGVAYIFVVIDNFSKFVRLYSMRRALAKQAVDRIVNDFHQILPIEQILSDRGTQFTSKIWQDRLTENGIKINHSSIRHPVSNPSERVMRELGRLFRTLCHRSHSGWATYLSQIEILFNSTPHLTTGFSPFEILYGKPVENSFSKFLGKYIPPSTGLTLEQIRDIVRQRAENVAYLRTKNVTGFDRFAVGDWVLLREHAISDASLKISSK